MYRSLAIGFALLCVPVCIAGVLSFESNMEDVFQWLPDASPERDVYDEFIAKFGADDFVVVSWPECTLGDARAEEFSQQLQAQDAGGYIGAAFSGTEILRLLQEKVRLDRAVLLDRFRGFYVGHDDQHTCVIVTLSQQGMDHRKASMKYLKSIAEQVLGQDVLSRGTDQLWVAGNPELGAYGDLLILNSMKYGVVPSCLVATLIAWFCLRSFKLTVLVLAVAGLGALLSIAVVTLSGAKWGGLSAVIPTLAFLMGVSGALHLVNYARSCIDEVGERKVGERKVGERKVGERKVGQASLARQILAVGWKPCLFSALTTAIGMLSLSRSEFPAVRHFGIYCACGVLVATVCQLLLIPNGIAWQRDALAGQRTQRWPTRLLRSVLRFRWPTVIGFSLLTLIFSVGLSRLQANMEVERAFRADTPVMQNIAQLEARLGPVEQTEIIVTFRDPDPALVTHRLAAIRKVQASVKQVPIVRGALSFADSLPEEPAGTGVAKLIQRGAYKHAVARAVRELGASPYLATGAGIESWRISVRVPFLETDRLHSLSGWFGRCGRGCPARCGLVYRAGYGAIHGCVSSVLHRSGSCCP